MIMDTENQVAAISYVLRDTLPISCTPTTRIPTHCTQIAVPCFHGGRRSMIKHVNCSKAGGISRKVGLELDWA